ncbi:hypothetical protein ABZ793_27955 [Micromonospora sp. NPDC047465]|uniref:hypothetical protein n=1 Tax=Micromonospora sp. NPDC047465 TaxID=3154813 RepID=UPI0033CEEE2A
MRRPPLVSGGLVRRTGLAPTVGWLLRTNRVLSPITDLRRASRFAPAFGGGSWPHGPVSESRVSRWESGFTPVPHAAVRRYEELLLLPPNTLVAPLDNLYRYVAAAEPLRLTLCRDTLPDDPSEGLDNLLDLAVTAAPLTGGQWDDLTAALVADPRIRLVPSASWSTITDRLVAEMVLSDGVDWLQRHEALNRLLAHPVGCQAAIDSCASLARDRENQVFIETVCALEATGHPDAARHVFAQLRDPTHQRARVGALLAAMRKLTVGHFTEEQVADLVPLVVDLLADRDTAHLAAQLAAGLPLDRDRRYRQFLTRHGTPVTTPPDTLSRQQTLAARIAYAASAEATHDQVLRADPILPVLVEDTLFHPSPDVRLYTRFLVAATPYRAALATALANELGGGRLRHDPALAEAILDSLRILGDRRQQPLVERLAIADGVPTAVRVSAAHAVGHLGDGVARTVVEHAAGRVAGPPEGTGGDRPVLEAIIYSLGVNGRDDLLRQLATDPRLPATARRSASWWLDRPAYVRRSASR